MSRLIHSGGAPTGEDVTHTGTLLFAKREGRKYSAIVNASTTHAMYLALKNSPTGAENQAVVGAGIYLSPNGGSYEINESNQYKGEVWAIHADVGNTHRACLQPG